MGADKRVYIGVVVLVLMAGVRIWWWEKTKVELKDGMQVKITTTVKQLPIEVMGIRLDDSNADYGDKIEVVGTISERMINNDRSFLRLDNQKINIIENGSEWSLYLANIRQRTFRNLGKWLGGDEGELGAGILVGGSGEMSQTGRENFRRTGVSHIVAASGYNVTVVAGVVTGGLVWLAGRRWSILFGIVCTGLYVILAGMSAAVVRAGIMAAAANLGLFFGRKGDGYWLLVGSCWLMIMANPGYIDDVGFLLSVAATIGVLWASPNTSPLAPLLGKERGTNLLKSIYSDFKVTMAAIVMTTPIILHYFGNLSVVAPLVNLLVVPVVPVVMGVVGMASLAGFLVPALGQWVSWLAWPVLKYMTLVVGWFGNQSWSSFEVGRISWLWVAGYYLVLVGCIKYWYWRR